ncbi:hypothetical protein EDB83DRAFT_2320701 [Lactarius deliciosus]|nr:hypothetical protein EDB83DRAFT_2320701 [Lactarius deliciosus]
MSNPSKSFLHSDDQQAGQVQKVKKVRQVQYCKMQPWQRDVMGVYEPWQRSRVGGRGVLSIGWWLCVLRDVMGVYEPWQRSRVGGRGVLSIWVGGCSVGRCAGVWWWVGGCSVGRHAEVWRVGGFACWVGVGGRSHGGACAQSGSNGVGGWGGSVGVTGLSHGEVQVVEVVDGGRWGPQADAWQKGEAAVTRVEQEAEAKLVVVLCVATAWWGEFGVRAAGW